MWTALKNVIKLKLVYAHCDLPCGVYNPAQARIEAESVQKIQAKYSGLSDTDKQRAIIIKEHRADLVKQHLWVLWSDYFKPEHLDKHPGLHDLIWRATKQASACKRSVDPAEGERLLGLIDEVAEVFAATKQ